MGRRGSDSGLSGRSDVARRKQAMLPILREPVKAMTHTVFLFRAAAPRCMAGYLWSSAARHHGRRIPLPDSCCDWIPCARALGAKNSVPSAGAQRGACLSHVSLAFGSVSWFQPIWTSQTCPRTCWFKPTRAGGAAGHSVSVVFRQRQCCLSNRSELVCTRPTLTLVAGDFVPGFQDCPERAGP